MNRSTLQFALKQVQLLHELPSRIAIPTHQFSSQSVSNFADFHGARGIPLADSDSRGFLLILSSLRDPSDLQKGRQVHSQILASGLINGGYLESCVLGMYILCGSLSDAKSLFLCSEKDSVLFWNWMIRGFSMARLFDFGLLFFFKMLSAGIFPDKYTFPYVIKSCFGLSASRLGVHVHKMVFQMGMEKDLFIGSSLIKFYAGIGFINDARTVFDRMPERDCVLCNVMMDGYVQAGDVENALSIFVLMMISEIRPNSVSFSSVLSLCASQALLIHGTQVHSLALKHGLDLEASVANTLLAMYSKCRCFDDAKMVFGVMSKSDLVAWNGMISGYVQTGMSFEAMELFFKMQDAGFKPDSITLASLLPSLSHSTGRNQGKEIHSYVLRNDISFDLHLKSALIDLHFKRKDVEMADKVFNLDGTMDVAICSAMISGYTLNGLSNDALRMFRKILKAKITPNAVTMASILPACSYLSAFRLGRELHGYVLKNSFQERCYVSSSLIDMYAKCGRIDLAHRIFRQISSKDIVSWNSMIANFNQEGHPEEVFDLLRAMKAEGMDYDAMTMSSALSSCARLPAPTYGKEIHASVIRTGLSSDFFTESCLIDMYGKCGELSAARRVFDSTSKKNEVSWNSIIAAYGAHGLLEEAIKLFEKMEKLQFLPDHITFLTLISACSHTGEMEEGFRLFRRMNHYNVVPKSEHYACMVDLFGRAGKLLEAFDFISKMPLKPDAGIWGALLGACRMHRNSELAELACRHLFELDPRNSGYYVLMSNIHAIAGHWGGVRKVRSLMKERNVQKSPGFSWIDIGKTNHMFVCGGESHPDCLNIYLLLKVLFFELKEAGYVPNPDFIYPGDASFKAHLSDL